MKLFEINNVANNVRGERRSIKTDSEIVDCSSSKSLNKLGDKEKNAISDPETKAEPRSRIPMEINITSKLQEKPSTFKNKKEKILLNLNNFIN